MGTRHASLQPPGLAGRSLSPTTALSKVVSLTSLNSYSAHAGPLPPGETLSSPPLTDSPQQLSPRELEQQRAAEAPHYFGGAAIHPHYMQQYAQPPGMPHAAAAPYGYPPPPLPHQPHAAYSNGSAAWGVPDYTPPPPLPPGYSAQRSPGQVPNVHSWPRLHQPGSHASGAPGRQQSLSSAASPQFYAANGAAVGSMLPPASGGSRHSRSDSFDQRPASASAAAMLMARSPSPLDLHGLERLEGPATRNGHASATPYNWQHRWAGCWASRVDRTVLGGCSLTLRVGVGWSCRRSLMPSVLCPSLHPHLPSHALQPPPQRQDREPVSGRH